MSSTTAVDVTAKYNAMLDAVKTDILRPDGPMLRIRYQESKSVSRVCMAGLLFLPLIAVELAEYQERFTGEEEVFQEGHEELPFLLITWIWLIRDLIEMYELDPGTLDFTLDWYRMNVSELIEFCSRPHESVIPSYKRS